MNELERLVRSVDSIFDYATMSIPGEEEIRYSVPSFPPAKIYVDKDNGDLFLKFALAGYDKKDLEISYDEDEGNYLILKTVDDFNKNEEKDDSQKIIVDNLKKTEFKYNYFVPSKFDKKTTKAEFKDGILTISIKLDKDKVPASISIN